VRGNTAKRVGKATAVAGIPEVWLAMIAPVHHMIESTGIFHSEIARHAASCTHRQKRVNTIDRHEWPLVKQ
jgi:hypothetical protein